MKAKVTLVEPIDTNPYYAVYFQLGEGWSLVKVFSFIPNGDGIWSKEKNLSEAMELVKRIEANQGKTETTIYETT